LYSKSEGYRIPRHIIRKDEIEGEIHRLEKAIEDSKKEIYDLETKISENISSDIGSIFGTHRMILQDIRLKNEIIEKYKRLILHPNLLFPLLYAYILENFRMLKTHI